VEVIYIIIAQTVSTNTAPPVCSLSIWSKHPAGYSRQVPPISIACSRHTNSDWSLAALALHQLAWLISFDDTTQPAGTSWYHVTQPAHAILLDHVNQVAHVNQLGLNIPAVQYIKNANELNKRN